MPIHPALIHLPLGLAIILPLVVGAIAFSLWRGELARKAWLLPVGLQALLVLVSLAAVRTGTQDEAKVKALVPPDVLAEHSTAGMLLMFAALAALLISASYFVLRAQAARRAVLALSMVCTVVVTGFALRVAHAGGELVYRHGAAMAHPVSQPPPDASTAHAWPVHH